MIWIILIALTVACGLYIGAPLLGKAQTVDRSAELKTYSEQIIAMDSQAQTPALAARRVQLQRRVLAITDARDAGPSATGLRVIFIAIIAGLLGVTAAVYAGLGRPDLSRTAAMAAPQTPPSPDVLAAQMKAALDKYPDNANGQTLYARLLINMGRYDEGLAAYDKAITLDPSETLRDEYDSAQSFVAQARAARDMTPEGRMEMISGMVDSLAARLEAEPDNPEGWTRLITSRRVLGQTEALTADVQTVREIFKDRPDVLKHILERSGVAE